MVLWPTLLGNGFGVRLWARPPPVESNIFGVSGFNLDNEQNSREQQIPVHSLRLGCW